MTKRLITAVAIVMAFAAATAYGAVTPIPPDRIPASCPRSDINGIAEQGDGADDFLDGTDQRDVLRGDGGSDYIRGSGSIDCLFGEAGRDRILGDPGADRIEGGGAGDVLKGWTGEDVIEGGKRGDRISGGRGGDVIHDTYGPNRITCGRGHDRVVTNRRSEVGSSCEHIRRYRYRYPKRFALEAAGLRE
jgi:hypothetical protein